MGNGTYLVAKYSDPLGSASRDQMKITIITTRKQEVTASVE